MAKETVQMPATTAGLTRFFDDYRSKIEFHPGHIILFAMIIMLVVIFLHIFGGSLLGL